MEQTNELKTAEFLATLIADWIFKASIGDQNNNRELHKDLSCFYEKAKNVIIQHPESQLAKHLSYQGELYRLHNGEFHKEDYDAHAVSWTESGSVIREHVDECPAPVILHCRVRENTCAVSINGLNQYLNQHGRSITDYADEEDLETIMDPVPMDPEAIITEEKEIIYPLFDDVEVVHAWP